MSLDEIRVQRALALLEFREAEEKVALLEKTKGDLVEDIERFASAVQRMPGEPGDSFFHNFGNIGPEAATAVCRQLHEARKRLADATAKKLQFGL